jgi:hypothetical protein
MVDFQLQFRRSRERPRKNGEAATGLDEQCLLLQLLLNKKKKNKNMKKDEEVVDWRTYTI